MRRGLQKILTALGSLPPNDISQYMGLYRCYGFLRGSMWHRAACAPLFCERNVSRPVTGIRLAYARAHPPQAESRMVTAPTPIPCQQLYIPPPPAAQHATLLHSSTPANLYHMVRDMVCHHIQTQGMWNLDTPK